MAKLRKLTKEEVSFEISVYEDIKNPRGNVICTGNLEEEKVEEDKIIKRLRDGDVWAWCTITVTAQWNGFKGISALGCCSYENKDDFMEDYYEIMKNDALNDLQSNIESAYSKLSILE